MSTQQVSFAIQGMTGPKSAMDIERTAAQLEGVAAAQVNYASERASVVYEPTRITAVTIVKRIVSQGFLVPLNQVALYSDDLLYATSAQTIEKVLGRVVGVVWVSADLGSRSVTLGILPDYARRAELEGALTRLGFRTIASPTIAAARKFKLRAFIITTLELLVVASAGAHAGLYPAGGFFHSPLTVMMLSAVVLFGVGWPFYNFAFDAGIQDEYDVGVLIALLASTFAIASLPFGMISPTAWLTSAGFVVASTLTAGWFILRATQILGLVHSAVNKQDAPPAPQTQLGVTPNGSRD